VGAISVFIRALFVSKVTHRRCISSPVSDRGFVMTTTNRTLLSPLKLGSIELPNSIIMAPLTRMRSSADGVPSDLNIEYYTQRASAGLIITEATSITADSVGVPNMPGIFTQEQIVAWRKVTDAVHARGGRIVIQIVHAGRASHSSLTGGVLPVAPSALAAPGGTYSPRYESVTYETPEVLALEALSGIVALFVQATENALEAGFDGVEIHGANGYLLDGFLQDGTNLRTDGYGGSITNRTRLLLEVVDAVSSVIGSDKVGVRLSPSSTYNGMSDSDPKALFNHVIAQLNTRHLAYLHMTEARASEIGMHDDLLHNVINNAEQFRPVFEGAFISAGGYTLQGAGETLAKGHASAVAFGRMYIANPDLVERITAEAELNKYDRATFYGGGAEGYVDYPARVAN
jgi:N-ethylmaleimide reductase